MSNPSRQLSDEEIARNCLTCRQGKWVHGVHECLRRVCKYRTSRKSAWFIGKEGL
jgi:hypothetical protein